MADSERTLFLIAILGGSPGSIAGMFFFATKHGTRLSATACR